MNNNIARTLNNEHSSTWLIAPLNNNIAKTLNNEHASYSEKELGQKRKVAATRESSPAARQPPTRPPTNIKELPKEIKARVAQDKKRKKKDLRNERDKKNASK